MADNFCANCGEGLKGTDQKYCAMCGHPTTTSNSTSETGDGDESLGLLDLKFLGQKYEGFSEDAFTFHNANRLLVIEASQKWFPGDYIGSQQIGSQLVGEAPGWIENHKINRWFLDGEPFFDNYETILWEESKFGERFLKALSARGAHVSHGYLGRVAEIEDSTGANLRTALSTPIDYYSGRWGLSDGTEYVQKGEVFKSKIDGHEIVYWHFDALANTRPSVGSILEKYSHRVLIPHFLQVATYLAETPFPSALSGSMGLCSRESTFGQDVIVKPRPITRFIKDGYLLGLQTDTTGNIAIGCWAPEIYQHGYVFNENMSDLEIYESLPVVCDGLPKIAEIIIDGYANWPAGSELDFQICLGSDIRICGKDEFFSHGATVPGIMYGKMFFKANHYYDTNYLRLQEAILSGDQKLAESSLRLLKEIAFRGVGSVFLHAANSLAATAIDIGLDWDFERLLENFSRIDVDSQGLNALSNLIIIKIKKNDFESASKLVDLAVEMCKRRGPNLETISHFMVWDGSVEVPIISEVYESAFKIKKHLGNIPELKYVSKEIVTYCDERDIEIEVLTSAKLLMSAD